MPLWNRTDFEMLVEIIFHDHKTNGDTSPECRNLQPQILCIIVKAVLYEVNKKNSPTLHNTYHSNTFVNSNDWSHICDNCGATHVTIETKHYMDNLLHNPSCIQYEIHFRCTELYI